MKKRSKAVHSTNDCNKFWGGGEANGDELVSNEANEDATSMHIQWAAVES